MRTADALGYVIGALERETGAREAHRAVWSAVDRAGICGVEAIDDGKIDSLLRALAAEGGAAQRLAERIAGWRGVDTGR